MNDLLLQLGSLQLSCCLLLVVFFLCFVAQSIQCIHICIKDNWTAIEEHTERVLTISCSFPSLILLASCILAFEFIFFFIFVYSISWMALRFFSIFLWWSWRHKKSKSKRSHTWHHFKLAVLIDYFCDYYISIHKLSAIVKVNCTKFSNPL